VVNSSDLESKLLPLDELRCESLQKDRQRVALCVFFAMLGGLFVANYWRPIGSWFYNDDPHWIGAVASHTVRELLFVPEVFRGIAPNFTPWLALTFKTDSVLFELAPLGYHLHDLAALIAASLAFFALARKWMSLEAALAAVLLLWASPITLATATWPSTRHYVEGLFFALVAIRLAMKPGWKAALGAGGLYFLSAAAKEVYVVLPAVAWLLVEGTFRERWKRSAFMWIGLGLYTVWHLTMMGGLGGYITNGPLAPTEAGVLLATTARSFAASWFGGHLWPVALLVRRDGGWCSRPSVRVGVYGVCDLDDPSPADRQPDRLGTLFGASLRVSSVGRRDPGVDGAARSLVAAGTVSHGRGGVSICRSVFFHGFREPGGFKVDRR
jgi:hypothetical protein